MKIKQKTDLTPTKINQRPYAMVLTISTQCNRKCIFCEVENQIELTKGQIDKILRRKLKEGIKEVRLLGGEPLLRKDLPDIVSLSKDYGFKTGIVTNGSILTEAYLQNLIDAGLDFVTVSFHSSKERTFDLLSGIKGSYKQTIGSLKNCIKRGIETRVNLVITKDNYKSLDKTIRYLYKNFRNIKKYSLFFAKTRGRVIGNHNVLPSYSEIAPYLEKALGFSLKKKLRLVVTNTPYCILKTEFRHLLVPSLNTEPSKRLDKKKGIRRLQYIKSKRCKSCKLDSICTGILKDYASLYGTKDIKPIK